MKQGIGLKKTAYAAYAVAAVLFVIFSVYMLCFEKTVTFSSRGEPSFEEIKDYTKSEISAPDAPIGIKKEYRFKTDKISSGDTSLMFYVVHSYIDVKLDDTLLYSTSAGKSNRIGSTPSSYWVVIPVSQLDKDKTVTVTVTPVFKSAENRKISFMIGSSYALFMKQLKADLPQLVLSSLCIVMGALIITVQLYLIFKKRTAAWNIFFLGNFSLLLGIWRITDTRFSALIFKNHTMPIGYITLAALFTLAAPVLLYTDKQYKEKSYIVLDIASIANSVICAVALICQFLSIVELRQILIACHIMLIADIAAIVSSAVFYNTRGKRDTEAVIFTAFLVSGGVLDIIIFYIKGSSSGMIITMVAFLIYTVYEFVVSLLNTNKKAYIDSKTKLLNKAYWEDLVKEVFSADEQTAMIMFDLNSLKHTNDTLGHNTGDKMISEFSSILKNELGSKELLCRWGGDEFTVFVRNADREKTEEYISAVNNAVAAYNRSGKTPEIYFACGYALSCDFPGISWPELLAKADKYMYENKKRWYSENLTDVR
ncbi:MAG TPA: hypothetical protein DCP17_05275 [Ruminococcaceae bacterium]|nr:hypothetical protein [Oscillospiraceae bacterium]